MTSQRKPTRNQQMLPKQVLYYGKEEPLPERIPLRAGPLSLFYEAGDLRYIRLGDKEIVRRVYVAIRDHNWGTVLPTFSNVQIDAGDETFRISYDVENRQGEIDFRWHGEISGAADGRIHLRMEGQAHSTLRRNRIGFCVLHPMSCAGAAARIEHVDGTVEESVFPVYIAPQLVIDGLIKPVAPFEEMAALTHEVTPGVWAEVRFEGEIFETEDQRNWTDASFKTYGTPLRLPFPVEITQGTKIAQVITLTLHGDAPDLTTDQTAGADQQAVTFRIPGRPLGPASRIPLPTFGLGVASHGQPLNEQELARLRALNLAHLRVDLRLSDENFSADLQRACEEAQRLGIALEIALLLTDDAANQLARLAAAISAIRPPVARWLVFHTQEKTTSARWVDLARQTLSDYDSDTPVGAGTNLYFTELNSSRPPVAALDVVAYSINPQVHAFDNASLVETLPAQAVTATSARQFCGDLPLVVSPVTLQPRFNPNATGPEPETAPDELPPQVDVRQLSLFGAGWTLGSIKYLAECGDVASITYYETTGWRGVMETTHGSPLPEKFQSIAGGVFPLYHILADVAEFAGGDVIPAQASEPLAVEGLVLHKAGRVRVLLANLTAEPRSVAVSGLGERVQIRILDETNAEAALREPEAFRATAGAVTTADGGDLTLDLNPFAVATIDTV
jgi:D-apionolactonase